MKKCSQCGASLNNDDGFCSKCGTAQPQSAEPKPKVLFEVPPTIEFLKKAFSERKINLARHKIKGAVLLFLSVDKALDEPAHQVVQKLNFVETSETHRLLNKYTPQIPSEHDRYEIIAAQFDKCFSSKRISAAGTLVILTVLAAFDGVYSENEKKLIQRFLRRWNDKYHTHKIEQSTDEAVETAILRLCENENKRREIRSSAKNYQQVTLELSAIAHTDEEILKGLFDLLLT